MESKSKVVTDLLALILKSVMILAWLSLFVPERETVREVGDGWVAVDRTQFEKAR